MLRSVWCQGCKGIVNTVAKGGKEVCPTCGKRAYRSTAG